MLFAFCGPGDTVLTAKCMDDAHADYLHAIGFQFNRNRFDLSPLDDEGGVDETEIAPTIFQRMVEDPVAERLEVFCPAGARLEPFAVLPGTAEVAKRYGLSGRFPSQDVIRTVNTKSYSLRMRDRLGIDNVGVTVGDVASLLDRGSELLRARTDPREGRLWSIRQGESADRNAPHCCNELPSTCHAQGAAGKRVRFVLEPYLRKRSDFSCQFRIDDDGRGHSDIRSGAGQQRSCLWGVVLCRA